MPIVVSRYLTSFFFSFAGDNNGPNFSSPCSDVDGRTGCCVSITPVRLLLSVPMHFYRWWHGIALSSAECISGYEFQGLIPAAHKNLATVPCCSKLKGVWSSVWHSKAVARRATVPAAVKDGQPD